jgi:hypothetical protein
MSNYLTLLSAAVALVIGLAAAAQAQPAHHQDRCFSLEYGFVDC